MSSDGVSASSSEMEAETRFLNLILKNFKFRKLLEMETSTLANFIRVPSESLPTSGYTLDYLTENISCVFLKFNLWMLAVFLKVFFFLNFLINLTILDKKNQLFLKSHVGYTQKNYKNSSLK